MKQNTVVVYLHGKGGTAGEAEHYRPLFHDCDVVGMTYRAATPWEAKTEFPASFQAIVADYERVTLIANSIGAYFAMCALPQEKVEAAYFISPVVDMERLIVQMMHGANVSEDELRKQGTIETALGETLSWAYLTYVRSHPVCWKVPTHILYGGRDSLTDRATVTAFADAHDASLTVMETGEHWFHTPEQMNVLDHWVTSVRTSVLRTERLMLRPWRMSDAESLYEFAKNPAIGPMAGWPPHTSVEESRSTIQNVLNGAECYAICERGVGKAIGCIELRLNGHTDMTERDDECELGYWLGQPFWGRGYMPEAADAMLRHAFETLGMTTVWCGYYDGNTKSKRVQEKLGFEPHHTCQEVPVPLMNEVRVGHTNVMTRTHWQKLQGEEK